MIRNFSKSIQIRKVSNISNDNDVSVGDGACPTSTSQIHNNQLDFSNISVIFAEPKAKTRRISRVHSTDSLNKKKDSVTLDDTDAQWKKVAYNDLSPDSHIQESPSPEK